VTSLTVALTGQVLLHGPLDLCGPGDRVRELIGEADLAAVNLEATVATEGAWPTKTKTLHPANPDGIASNNHAFDLAPPGLAQTRVVAEGAGLHLVGRGENRDEAARPVDVELRKVRGGDVERALVAAAVKGEIDHMGGRDRRELEALHARQGLSRRPAGPRRSGQRRPTLPGMPLSRTAEAILRIFVQEVLARALSTTSIGGAGEAASSDAG
jgi:hypothetical protein